MNTTTWEILEQHIHCLLETLAQVKAENVRLSQSLSALHDVRHERQPAHADWEAAQAELLDLRAVIHTLRQERELIRVKLETMLGAVERLEAMSFPVEKP